MFFGIRAQKQFQLSSDNIYKTLIMLIEININTSEENCLRASKILGSIFCERKNR
ncbi:MAG: hypothetical protein PWR23_429 [Peptostreptococcaceae bacterium]|nr:hypothetical protein [Peptostreptococcaceae bacterium]